jgi:PleD family two-component response regulator
MRLWSLGQLSHWTVVSVLRKVKNADYLSAQSARNSMDKIRVLLADDHRAILQRVCGILGDDFEIVGAVNNGRDAVVAALRFSPDVLVIDISMPGLSGFASSSAAARRKTIDQDRIPDRPYPSGFHRRRIFCRRFRIRDQIRSDY